MRGQPLTSHQFGFPSDDIAGLTNLAGGGDDGPDGQEIVLVGLDMTWWDLI